MRLIVVEPHPDDAFLSVGWHLETVWAEYDCTILTVYTDRRRQAEAGRYAAAVGAESVVLNLPESKMLSRLRPSVIPELRVALAKMVWDVIVFPLGLQHPDHLNVSMTRVPGALRYLDSPYLSKHKLATSLLEKTRGMRVESILFPPKRKWRHIPIFTSQAKFFYFNQMEGARLPEVVLCPD
jgi:hypothetical protein